MGIRTQYVPVLPSNITRNLTELEWKSIGRLHLDDHAIGLI
jgi:hypothetical protein